MFNVYAFKETPLARRERERRQAAHRRRLQEIKHGRPAKIVLTSEYVPTGDNVRERASVPRHQKSPAELPNELYDKENSVSGANTQPSEGPAHMRARRKAETASRRGAARMMPVLEPRARQPSIDARKGSEDNEEDLWDESLVGASILGEPPQLFAADDNASVF